MRSITSIALFVFNGAISLGQCDPVVVGTWQSGSNSDRGPDVIRVQGDLIYVIDGGDLFVLDGSDLANIQLLGTFDRDMPDNGSFLGGGLALTETHAYISEGLWSTQVDELEVYDITDPTAPELVGTLATQEEGAFMDLEIRGDVLFAVERYSGLYYIDISDPASPSIIGLDTQIWGTECGFMDVFIDADRAYLADCDWGLRVYDISDPQDPMFLGRPPGFFFADDMHTTVYRGLAHIGGWNSQYGVHTIDVSDSTSPVFVESVDIAHDMVNVVPVADMLITSRNRDASGGDNESRGVYIYDVTDTNAPVEIAGPISTFQNRARLHEGLLYCAETDLPGNGIVIYGISSCLPCSDADLADPRGVLDFSDVAAFLSGFATQLTESDLAEPYRVWDFSDVLEYLAAFAAGCP